MARWRWVLFFVALTAAQTGAVVVGRLALSRLTAHQETPHGR